jgi:protein O-mannosyl-transferase
MISPESRLSGKHRSVVPGCLMLAAFLLYGNTLLNQFVYDDHAQVEESTYVHSFKYVGRIFTTTVWSFQGEEGQSNYYRPLMMLSYLLSNKVFQSYPLGFHLVNLFFNCGVIWLVFSVCLTLYQDEWVALVAAFIFAFHPIHSEVVAWIAALTELQLAFFYLAAFLFFLRIGQDPHSRGARTQVLLYGSFICALLSKEQAITLPVVAVVYEHFFRADRGTTSWKTKFGRYAGLWLIAALYLLFRIFVLRGFAPVVQRPELTVWQLFLSGLALFGQYIGKLFWPHPLLGFYVFQKSMSLSDPRVLGGIVSALMLFALFVSLWRRARPYAFALFWIALTIAPVLNVRWMAASAFAERYLYLPSFGFCVLVAGGAVWLAKRYGNLQWARWVGAIAALVLLAASSAVIVARNRDWRDDSTYFTSTIAVEPHASYMRTTLGVIAWQRNQHAEAERQWKLALADKPDNAIALADLGMAKIEQKQWDEAEADLRKAMELRPHFAAPHFQLGRIYEIRGRNDEAEAEYRRAVEIFPLSPEFRNSLGKFYLGAGRLKEAEEQFRGSLEGSPTSEAHDALGDILVKEGFPEKAVKEWNESLQLSPFDEHASLGLARIYFAAGQRARAEKQYRAVLLLDMNNAEALKAMHELRPAEFPNPHP